ncbi:hypothetical protein ScPMuIL_006532 [Solemya velum]
MLRAVLTGNVTFQSLKPLDLSKCTKQQIEDYFVNSYELNESIFTGFKDESVFYKRPDNLRLPMIFYFGHTAVVYVNKMMIAGMIQERVNFDLETMLETGVDEMTWDDTVNYRMGGGIKWPSLEEVVDYRRTVRNIVLGVIRDTPLELPITKDSPWWALVMGMEHERIHLDTSSVLIRQMPAHLVSKPPGWCYAPNKHGSGVSSNPLIQVEEREVTYGKPENFSSYGWDNEYGQVTCVVPKFEASKYLITNGEFEKFVKAGGYQSEKLWTEEGWKWKTYRQANHPTFWVCDNGCKGGCGGELEAYSPCHFPGSQNGDTDMDHSNGTIQKNGSNGVTVTPEFMYRAMYDVIAMPWDWPVEVNFHEARAFCRWKGPEYRLPVEAEHNVMRGEMECPEFGVKSDPIFGDKLEANLNLKYGSSTPVNMFSASSLGFHDLMGNVWEWVEDHFNGLQGFHTHYLYDDFSSPCFDGRHNMMLGGCWVSTGDEASRFARFAFRRHFFQHLGFRIARVVQEKEDKVHLPVRLIKDPVYVLGVGEQDTLITLDQSKLEMDLVPTTNSQYRADTLQMIEGILEMEFGFRKSFPKVLAELSMELVQLYDCRTKSVAWFGSGSGCGPIELVDKFEKILAVDYSGRCIDTAKKLVAGGSVTYRGRDGERQPIIIDRSNQDLSSIDFQQLTWACNEIGIHDLCIMTFFNRVMHPKAWLTRLWELVHKNGIFVLAAPEGEWDEEKLTPYLHTKLKCVESRQMAFETVTGRTNTMVTVWQHK